jgi:hypothetical protein
LSDINHVAANQYKVQSNLSKHNNFIAKDRVLSIKFIDSGNQFAQLISGKKKQKPEQ